MAFGKELLRLREKAGLTPAKLAKKLGVDAARLRKWEERDSNPKQEDQVLIESAFGLTIEEIKLLDELPKTFNEEIFVKDALATMLQNQIELMTTTRVILSILAEVQSHQSRGKISSTHFLSNYRKMAKDVAELVRKELKQTPGG